MKPLILTIGITGYGAIGGLLNPYVGFLAYVALALLKPDSLWEWTVPQANYSRIVAICMLIGWALHGFGNWRFGKATIPVVTLVGFWIWSVVGALQAPIPDVAWKFVDTMTKIILPFIVGISLIDSVYKLRQLAWVIVLTQGYVAFEMSLSYYVDGFNRVLAGYGGMDECSIGIYAVSAIGVAIHLGISSTKLWQRILCLFVVMMLAHVPMMSEARGSMLGLIVVVATSFLIIPKKPTYYATMVVIVALGMQLAGPSVRDEFMTSFESNEHLDESAKSRYYLWGCCWEMMKAEPVFGVGPDHFPYTISRFGRYDFIEAHNTWLQIGAETGFPGIILLAGFYVITVLLVWKYTRERCPVPDPMIRSLCRMVISSVAGFAVSAMFISIEGMESPYYVALIGIGALKVMSTPIPEGDDSECDISSLNQGEIEST